MNIVGAGLTALLLAVVVASAEARADGNELLTQCQQFIKVVEKEPDYDSGRAGMCIGYVEGFISTTTFFSSNLEDDAKLCIPKTVPNGQVVRVLVKYLKDNPAKLNKNKASLVWLAMRDAYPCPK